jgi:geranylgeranyl transferase type-2 subunit alpha
LRKKKEQAQKVLAYRAAISKIFEQRKNDEITQDIVDLTAKVLSSNPDISTLWNIRREFILKHAKELGDLEQSVFDRELNLTEGCLQVNPKSYCAWHQRCWTLENAPNPNWQNEVKLCSKYLKIDERNFHCWDYRRYVAEKAAVSSEDELKFCTEKIQNNFSNYSSWHYRSKLLAELYPHPTAKHRPITEDILKKELDLVLEAAFTDPNDSSAWFYQRWLFGYAEAVPDLAAFKHDKNYILLSFSIPINMEKFKLHIPWLTSQPKQTWKPVNSLKKYDTTWILQEELPFCEKITSKISLESETGTTYTIDAKKVGDNLIGVKVPKFGYKFGDDIIDTMKSQLESCNSLLELEPDSKCKLKI